MTQQEQDKVQRLKDRIAKVEAKAKQDEALNATLDGISTNDGADNIKETLKAIGYHIVKVPSGKKK